MDLTIKIVLNLKMSSEKDKLHSESEEEQADRIFSTRIGKTLPSYSTGSISSVKDAIRSYEAYIQSNPTDGDAKFILEDLRRILSDM